MAGLQPTSIVAWTAGAERLEVGDARRWDDEHARTGDVRARVERVDVELDDDAVPAAAAVPA